MSRSRLTLVALTLSLGVLSALGGCQSNDPAPPHAPTPPAPPAPGGGGTDSAGSNGATLPPPGYNSKYDGPAFTIDVLQMESFPVQYAVNYEVTVNSGGWKLIKERETFEGGVLTVWLTLEAPGKGEIVTMALETLEGRFAAGTAEVDRVEIHVKRTRRGEDNSGEAYRLAARWPADSSVN